MLSLSLCRRSHRTTTRCRSRFSGMTSCFCVINLWRSRTPPRAGEMLCTWSVMLRIRWVEFVLFVALPSMRVTMRAFFNAMGPSRVVCLIFGWFYCAGAEHASSLIPLAIKTQTHAPSIYAKFITRHAKITRHRASKQERCEMHRECTGISMIQDVNAVKCASFNHGNPGRILLFDHFKIHTLLSTNLVRIGFSTGANLPQSLSFHAHIMRTLQSSHSTKPREFPWSFSRVRVHANVRCRRWVAEMSAWFTW